MKMTRIFAAKINDILRKQLPRYVHSKPKVKRELGLANKLRSQEIYDNLNERGLAVSEIGVISPFYFRRETQKRSSFLLVDRQIAKLIAGTIFAEIKGEHVLEFDAGIGIMSEILLPLTENLRLYAPNSRLAAYLQDKFQNDPNEKLKVFNKSFSNIVGILYSKMQDSEEFYKLVEGLPCKPWTEDITLSIITPITHVKFMKSLVTNLVHENSLKQFGRPEFFFLLPTTIAEPLLFKDYCPPRQIPIHFLFNIFFDIKILLNNIPRNAFLPWPSTKMLEKKLEDNLFLIHAVPKLDKFEPYTDHQFLNLLDTFVKSTLRQRKRIIPIFESFVPNCGARFIIEDNLDIYTEFHEITPDTLFHIFKKLTSYREFDIKLLERDECETVEDEPDASDDSDFEENENKTD